MSSLEYFIVMDLDSGTYFSADGAVLIDTRELGEDQHEILLNGSDTELADLGSVKGICLDELIDFSTEDLQ